jgi:TonB family protein
MFPKEPARLRDLTTFAILTSSILLWGFPASAKTSTDPRALMQLAAKTTGLNGTEVQPWHLKFSFKALDEKGAILDEGSYEEIWINPIKFKRTLKGATHTLTDYGTEKGVFRSGDEKKASTILNDFHLAILNPLPAAAFIKVTDAREEERSVSGVKCHCVDLREFKSPGVFQEKPGYSYCFDANKVLLQASMAAWDNTQYTLKNSIQFQGHTMPGDVEIWNRGIVVETAHLESIEVVKEIDEAAFQVPGDAVLHGKSNFSLPADVATGLLLKKVAPIYPPIAFEARVEGTVILKGVIGKEGRILNLRAVGGPPMLQQAAIDAVQQWVYRPYMLNGLPVEVETTITIPFTLSGR